MKILSRLMLILFPVVLMVALAGAFRYLRSDKFQEFARATLISRVERATGMVCTVERLRLDVFRGQFRLEGSTLRARTPRVGPLTLSIDEMSGRVSVSSLWHFNLHLAELNITRPQVALISAGGRTGWNPEEFLKSLRMSLDLAAGRVSLTDGWVKVNNTLIPLNLSLDDVTCELHYAAYPRHYSIRLAYKNSRLIYEGRDIKYDLDTRIGVSLEGVDIESFRIRRGKSLLIGNGWVKDWKSPALLLRATGNLDGEDLALFTSDLRDARGSIKVATNFRVDAAGLRLDGSFVLKAGGYHRATLSALRGMFVIQNDVLLLKDVDGKLGEGVIHANGEIQLREANKSPHHVSVSTKGVPLREVSWILNLPEISFDNAVDSSADVVWKHVDRDLELTVQAYLHAPSESRSGAGRSTFLQGNLSFSYKRGFWYLTTANLNSPNTTVEITGLGGTTFHIHAQTSQLAEPFAVLRGFIPSLERLISRQPDVAEISGTFGLNGEMLLEPERTAYQGELTIKDGRWRSYRVDSMTSKAIWEGAHLELRALKLRKGTESAEGDLVLDIPSEEAEPPGINFQGKVSQVSLASLEELGVEIGPDITGILSGSGSVSNAEGSWSGAAQFQIDKGSYRDEQFDSLRGQLKAQNEILQIEDCQITRGAATVTARGQVRLDTRQMDIFLRLAGLSLTEIPSIRDNKLEIEGHLVVSGELRGAMDNPAFKGNFELTGLRYSSWNLGQGKGTLELADKILQGSSIVQSDLGKLAAQAKISMESGLPGKASLEFWDWNVQKILAGNVPPLLSELSTALHGKVEAGGKFAEPAELSASGEVDGARFKIHDYELHNAGKIRFTVSNQNILFEKVNVVGEGTSLFLSGVLPLDSSPRFDMGLNGNLNLVFLQHLEKKIRVSGSAVLNVRATGALQDPQVIGQAALQNARLEYGDLPVHLSSMQGNIIFSRNLVRFENVRGAAGSGSIQLSGLLEQKNSELRGINLQVSAQQVRLPYPKDFRSVVNAELILRGNQGSQVLSGDINVLRADYMKDINLLEQLANRSNAPPGPLTTDPFLLGLRLDVDIHSDRGLFVDNELTRLRGSVRLNLRGTPAYPYLTGRVEASDGSIFFRGNRFDIQHASADFLDRNRINPILDVRAEADVKSYRLVLDVNGDLDHLSINVTSDPPLSTVDIVSMLTTGKSLEPGTENTRRQAEITGLSAASILSESLTGVVGKRVQRIFGLETFRVDPFLAGAENDPTARVTISERISKDMTVTFSRNLSTNEEQIVIVEYDVNRNLTVVASRDEQGKFGLDFRFRKRFR